MSHTSKPKVSGVVVPQQAKWHQRLAAWIIQLFIRLLTLTVRCRLHDPAGLFNTPRKEAFIFCFWHNRLAMCVRVRDRFAPGSKLAGLVSASKDGALLAAVFGHFGVQPVRGSSSRRGPQALREMVSWGERGYDLAITPDGPRGPCYQVADGVTSLAQLTGLRIVPVSFNLNWKISVKSWDKFQIPLPFARCEVRLAETISVPRDATDEQREVLRLELEKRLREISHD